MKKTIAATVSYVVLSMMIAYPWHMLWFHDLYIQLGAVTRAQPIIPLGLLSLFIQGYVIAYLYPYYYRGGQPIIQGIKFTLTIGLMIYTVQGFATAAKMDINPVTTYLLYHTFFQLLQFIVTGIALGLIYGKYPIKS